MNRKEKEINDEYFFRPLILTGELPREENVRSFYLFILHCKSIGVYFYLDLRKLLWSKIRTLNFKGRKVLNIGDFVLNVNPDDGKSSKISSDFVILTLSMHSDHGWISFNDVQVQTALRTLLYVGALTFTDVKIERGKYSVEYWSFNDLNNPLGRLSSALNYIIYRKPLNSKAPHNSLISYENGKVRINYGFVLMDKKVDDNVTACDIEACIKSGVLRLGDFSSNTISCDFTNHLHNSS